MRSEEERFSKIEQMPQNSFDKINDREIFMNGIDRSYYYEGYSNFECLTLAGVYNFNKT